MSFTCLQQMPLYVNFVMTANKAKVKIFYQITSVETGRVIIRRRKIAKALRWWLRENGIVFNYKLYVL
jgi:predicted RNA-binding protein YlqC (UPF0109 family)